MAELTPRLSLYMPADDGSEPVNVATDLNDNLQKIDAVIGAVPATSSVPPATTFIGMFRQNTDTNTLEYLKSGNVWTQILSKGVAFVSNIALASGYKIGINTLTPVAIFEAVVASSTSILARMLVGSEVNPRIQIDSDGIRIGPGGATATDVRVYRSASNTLNITGNVVVENNLQVSGTPSFAAGFAVTDAAIFNGDVNLNGGIDVLDHITYNAFPILVGQRGSFNQSITSAQTSTSSAVSFGKTYPSAPSVVCNLAGQPGGTASWTVRAINVTTTGFTAQYNGTAPGSTVSLATTWTAFHEGA
jgi:hypothetical protein